MSELYIACSPSYSAFGISDLFTAQTCRNTPQCSMTNLTLELDRSKRKKFKLKYSKKLAIGETYIKQLYFEAFLNHCKLKRLMLLQQIQEAIVNKNLDSWARVIQKHVKGWQTRKKNEKIIIEVHKRTTRKRIHELSEFTESMFYSGDLAIISATNIQKHFRGWRNRNRCKSFIRDRHLKQQRARNSLRILINSAKIIERHKEFKLKIIRTRILMRFIKHRINRFRDFVISKRVIEVPKEKPKEYIEMIFDIQLKSGKGGFTINDAQSSSESVKTSRPTTLLNIHRPNSAVTGVPILIEKKRHSQIWIEAADFTEKLSAISLKRSSTKSLEKTRPNTRKNSILNFSPHPPKHRNSISFQIP